MVTGGPRANRKELGTLIRFSLRTASRVRASLRPPASVAEAPKDKQMQMTTAARNSANATTQLLTAVKEHAAAATPAAKTKVQAAAKTVAESINKVVEVAGQLLPNGYVDPNDPNVIAERELLAAASSIEAAARKLAMLVPPERPREANEQLNFEEQILEAAKAIASASSALVRSATQAQRELMAAGRNGPGTRGRAIVRRGQRRERERERGGEIGHGAHDSRAFPWGLWLTRSRATACPFPVSLRTLPDEDKVYFSDGTWSDGLVSAARLVAASTKELCDCANSAVQGSADKPMLIAAANSVASSTAQLLSAATVKMDSSSESGQRLRAAGGAVTRATRALVEAAEANLALEEPDKLLEDFNNLSVVGSRKAEIEQKAKLERLRIEFERAQREYAAMNQRKYGQK